VQHDAKNIGELAVGVAMAKHFHGVSLGLKKQLEDLQGASRKGEEELKKLVASLTEERDGLQAKLDQIKSASGAGRRAASVPTFRTPASSAGVIVLEPHERADHLDRLRDEAVSGS
jgi:hypothetical protein